MILARRITSERPADLTLAFCRLGLSSTAQEYLLEKLPQQVVLLTGLTVVEGRFLKRLSDLENAPGREEFPFFVSGDQSRKPGTALLAGRLEQFRRLSVLAAKDSTLLELSEALKRAFDASSMHEPMTLGPRTFEFGSRTYLMGVVNVTPDSFSDGGRYLGLEEAVAHGLRLVEQGADVLDVGGESSRPGAAPVSAEEEIRRVVPVIERLVKVCPRVPVSVDTTKSQVAQAALEAGAVLVNDISGFCFDKKLPQVVARANASACVMHMKGTPQTMQQNPQYDDVVSEVLEGLAEGVSLGVASGISKRQLMVDPGIGFGKTLQHNLMLLRRLADLRQLGLPILLGTSRKSFIGQLTGGKPAHERLAGTLASVVTASVLGAADFVRVHDVAEAKDALAVTEAILQAREN